MMNPEAVLWVPFMITKLRGVQCVRKKSKNRCQLEESAWIKGEPMVGKTVDQRRYKIQYQCNYGKRADTKKDYVPTISPPTVNPNAHFQNHHSKVTKVEDILSF